MASLTINNEVYEEKLNYAFYNQLKNDPDLKTNTRDGFSNFIDKLLDGDLDMIIKFHWHALAWFKRNQPAENKVFEALEQTVFTDDEKTDQEITNIIEALKADGFLARKLSKYLKDLNKSADLIQKRIDGMEDGDKKDELEMGLEQIQDQIEQVKKLLAEPDSSPKPEESDSQLTN
ncbi:tail assembly chaperone [Lactobacillus sp. 3B(2020)]|uniref:tail assembly chaperone n=1 Tax=Lactobacillus sp. 3B(2020) TaxID=2695882 RepID=UPI0015DE19E2|nr:tail assembly chaperone [Lactobacillus sp. 3B(2020)]QLL69599.1 hypothetical protein GTO83_03110 [Lactobacillus sp. 3B(2020)]